MVASQGIYQWRTGLFSPAGICSGVQSRDGIVLIRVWPRGRRRSERCYEERHESVSTGSSTNSYETTTSTPIAGQTTEDNVERGLFIRNEYGAAIGGRIIRDRTFFFANYEAVRQGSPDQFLATVPTAEQKAGDFSKTLDSQGRLIVDLRLFDDAPRPQ